MESRWTVRGLQAWLGVWLWFASLSKWLQKADWISPYHRGPGSVTPRNLTKKAKWVSGVGCFAKPELGCREKKEASGVGEGFWTKEIIYLQLLGEHFTSIGTSRRFSCKSLPVFFEKGVGSPKVWGPYYPLENLGHTPSDCGIGSRDHINLTSIGTFMLVMPTMEVTCP
jgi:hypothetical protein